MPKRAVIFACLALAAIFASGCGSSSAVTLRLDLQEGKTYAFDTKVTQSLSGAMNSSSSQTLTANLKVEKASDSKFETITTLSDVEAKAEGMNPLMPTPEAIEKEAEALVIKNTYDSRGRSVATGSAAKDANLLAAGISGPGANFMSLQYPEGAVEPGATWEVPFDVSKLVGNLGAQLKPKGDGSLPIRYTFRAFENSGGRRLAVIEYSMAGDVAFTAEGSEGEIKIKTNSSGTAKVDPKTGIPVVSSSKSTNEFDALGMKGTLTLETSMKLKG